MSVRKTKTRYRAKTIEYALWDLVGQLDIARLVCCYFQRHKPPSYFKTLLDILNVLVTFFYGSKIPQDETLLKMRSLLQMYAADSQELISRFVKDNTGN